MKIGDRLSKFSVQVTQLASKMKLNYLNEHLIKQLLRSSSSAALNYSEARGAASDRDYVHKTRISLKEIKESKQNIELLLATNDRFKPDLITLHQESDELAAILYTCIVRATSKYDT